MIKNFQELISQIKTQVPIQELISEYIPVKKSGRGFVAVCPFHDDHHPSMQIHPQKGIFKCFACGTGGDLITFYALINKKKFSEVVPELAQKYGLKVEYGEENKTETQIKNKLYDLNKDALEFFKRNLYNQNDQEALDYLTKKRKLTPETINKFQIGFAQNNWDSLYNYLAKEKQFPQELIIASGLFILKENQNSYYDRFRNRVIFPICNESNNIVGFGGRTLSKEDSAKYINSPETLIYNKGSILYGLNFAKEEIKKEDGVVLTEGYLDVITAHQSGLFNTVATLGTALTSSQARLLTKYTESKKVCLCLDSDLAGKKAVENIFYLIQEISQFVSLDLRVITNLSAKDLDESIIAEGVDSIREKIKDGQKLTHFILDKISKEYSHNQTSEVNKKSTLEQLIEIIIATRDPIEQKDNVKYISHKLNIEEELINLKIKDRIKYLSGKSGKSQKNAKFQDLKPKAPEDAFKMHSIERFKHAELELLSLYISSFPHNSEIKTELSTVQFLDEKHSLIKDFLDNVNEINISPNEITNKLIIEFNEYKHMMSVITDLAWRIETEENNYSKNKEKILTEAKEWINWWIKHKQKMKNLTDLLKECKNGQEEKEILTQMINLVKN